MTGIEAAVGLFVACALLGLWVTAGRARHRARLDAWGSGPRRHARTSAGPWIGGDPTGEVDEPAGPGLGDGWVGERARAPSRLAAWWPPARAAARTPTGRDLALLVGEVAARLRSGAPVAAAWDVSWARGGWDGSGRPTEDGVPEAVAALADRPLGRSVGRVDARTRAAVRAARILAAACRFTHHVGAPVASVLEGVADGIDEAEAAEEARRVARTGPATSARVLTVLPLVAVLLAELVGADPVGRWVDGGIGTVCFLAGAACLVTGRIVSVRMVRAAVGDGDEVDAAVLCDVARSGLESGASVPTVLVALGRALGDEDVERVGRELVLGVGWRVAWQGTPPEVEPLARALEPAWEEGTSPVLLLQRAAAQVRARRVVEARERAERLGVRLVLPVAALFLPAFVFLAVVPVLVHVLEQGLGAAIGVTG